MARTSRPALLVVLLLVAAVGGTASRAALAEPPPADPDLPPPGAAIAAPWLDEVRAQRRMLQELRRAQQEARKDRFLRRRQEIIEFMDSDRWLFRNPGPWMEPFIPPPEPQHTPPRGSAGSLPRDPNDELRGHPYPPSGWDNRWYFNGW
ncbi:MAG: hypothetical protein EA400_07245 [Chromatiaceae bacterium]|nr:MAG: hypothetical protein EA400_07245 [Chromatiaceae bacterium]